MRLEKAHSLNSFCAFRSLNGAEKSSHRGARLEMEMSRNLLVPILIGFMLVSTGQSQGNQTAVSQAPVNGSQASVNGSVPLPGNGSVPLPGNGSVPLPGNGSAPLPGNASIPPVIAPNPILSGNRSIDLSKLPDGRKLSNLTGQYIVANGSDGDWSKVVANNQSVYVLHPVQNKNASQIYDPYTIGQVLGYIYEVQEFGGIRPANGYTIELMGKPIPRKKKRSPLPRAPSNIKDHRAKLIFKRKVPIRVDDNGDPIR